METYSYDVFGEPNRVSDVNNPYMFTGRRYDSETGLYYYRARYYKPSIGRFLQTDPIGYADGLNLYTYCGNNPLVWADPYGLCKEDPWYGGLLDELYYTFAPLVGLGPEGYSAGEAWGDFAVEYSRASQGVANVFTGGLFGSEYGIFYNTFNRQWASLGYESNVNSRAFRSGETGGRVAEALLLTAAGVKAYEMATGVRIEIHLYHINKTTGKLRAGPHLQGIKGPGWGDTVWRFGFHP